MNHTRIVDDGVEKRFTGPSRRRRWGRELEALRLLEGTSAAPKLVRFDASEASIVTERIAGVNAVEILERRGGEGIAEVLAEAGRILRELEDLGVTHGDFGIQNLIVSPQGLRVVDWEWYGVFATPNFDALWFDFIVRYHYPDLQPHLPRFWGAYGAVPGEQRRRDAWQAACRARISECAPGSRSLESWTEKLQWVQNWGEERPHSPS